MDALTKEKLDKIKYRRTRETNQLHTSQKNFTKTRWIKKFHKLNSLINEFTIGFSKRHAIY